MSTTQNTIWLEETLENFEEANVKGDVERCKSIIADLQEQGFIDEARELNLRLRAGEPSSFFDAMMIRFLKKMRTKYQEQGLIPTLDLVIEELENHNK